MINKGPFWFHVG